MFGFVRLYIRRNKKVAFSYIIKIALATMLCFSLIQMGNTMATQYKVSLLADSIADFLIRDISEVEKDQIVEMLSPDRILVPKIPLGYINLNGKSTIQRGWLWAGTESGLKLMDGIEIVEGEFPHNPFEIAIEKSYNDNLPNPYKIGDKVEFQISKSGSTKTPTYEFTITGFSSDSKYRYQSGGWVSYVVTAMETAKQVTTDLDDPDLYQIEYLSDENLSNYNEEIIFEDFEKVAKLLYPDYELLTKRLKNGSITQDETTQLQEITEEIQEHIRINPVKTELYGTKKQAGYQMNISLHMLAIFISLASFILIFNSFHMTFSERVRQFGSMYCIGMSKNMLKSILFLEGSFYLILGYLLGVGLGLGLNQIMAGKIISLLSGAEVPILYPLYGFIMTFLLSALSIFISISLIYRKASKLSPLEMMNYSENNTAKKQRFPVSNVIMNLSLKNIARNPVKSKTMFLSLVICNLLLITVVNSFLSLNFPEKNLKSQFSDYEIYQSLNTNDVGKSFDSDVLAKLSEMEGVKTVYSSYSGIYEFIKFYGTEEIIVSITYNDQLFQKYCEENKIKNLDSSKPSAIAIGNSNLVGEMKIEIRNLRTWDKLPEIKDVTIIGNAEEMPLKHPFPLRQNYEHENCDILIINEACSQSIFGDVYYDDIMIDYKFGHEANISEINEIMMDFEGVIHHNYDIGMEAEFSQLLGMILIALYVIVAMIVMLLGIESSNIKTSFTTQAKEYAVLQAIGGTFQNIKMIICLENAILALYAGVSSLVVAIPVNIVVTSMFLDSVKLNPFVMVIIPIFNIIICGILPLCYMKKLKNQSVCDNLHQE